MDQDKEIQNIEIQEDTESSDLTDVPDVVEDSNVLVIKGKFKFQGSGIYGVWMLLVNKDFNKEDVLNNIVEFKLFASYFSDMYHIDISESWVTLEEKFNQIQIKNSYAVSITDLFRGAFDDKIYNNDVFLHTLINDYKNNNFETIYNNFESVFLYIHKDRQIIMDFQMEELDVNDITSIRQSRVIEEKPKINQEFLSTPTISVNSEALHVPASPVLAPVIDGILAGKIKQGMRILMKLDPSSSYGQKWVEIFNAFNEKEKIIIPIVATVDQIGPIIKNKLDVLVTYQPNQYTKFNVESNVKLRLYNLSNKEQTIDPLVVSEEKTTDVFNWKTLYSDTSFRILVVICFSLFVLSIWGFIMLF